MLGLENLREVLGDQELHGLVRRNHDPEQCAKDLLTARRRSLKKKKSMPRIDGFAHLSEKAGEDVFVECKPPRSSLPQGRTKGVYGVHGLHRRTDPETPPGFEVASPPLN